jgi:hypothetical protein
MPIPYPTPQRPGRPPRQGEDILFATPGPENDVESLRAAIQSAIAEFKAAKGPLQKLAVGVSGALDLLPASGLDAAVGARRAGPLTVPSDVRASLRPQPRQGPRPASWRRSAAAAVQEGILREVGPQEAGITGAEDLPIEPMKIQPGPLRSRFGTAGTPRSQRPGPKGYLEHQGRAEALFFAQNKRYPQTPEDRAFVASTAKMLSRFDQKQQAAVTDFLKSQGLPYSDIRNQDPTAAPMQDIDEQTFKEIALGRYPSQFPPPPEPPPAEPQHDPVQYNFHPERTPGDEASRISPGDRTSAIMRLGSFNEYTRKNPETGAPERRLDPAEARALILSTRRAFLERTGKLPKRRPTPIAPSRRGGYLPPQPKE